MFKILIVDDEPDLLATYKSFFRRYQCELDAVEDPEVAVDKVNQEKYDLIITDLNMPHLTGFELLDEVLKSQNNKAPVLVISAYLSDKMKKLVLTEDHFSSLTKPISHESLHEYAKGLSGLERKPV